MDRAEFQELFQRYLDGHCSPEEVALLLRELGQPGAREALKGPLRDLWEQHAALDREYPVDWEGMRRTVAVRRRLITRRSWIATLGVLAAVAIVYVSLPRRTRPHPVIASNTAPSAPISPAKTQTIHLPDGSTVGLNQGSKLEAPAQFSGSTREVTLEGEGYFDVRHLDSKPFVVHTGNLTVRVLGTAFDIKAYPRDDRIAVTVATGRVQVSSDRGMLGLVRAHEQITFSKRTALFTEAVVDLRPILAWKPEEIRLEDVTLAEAATRLEAGFGIKVTFQDPAAKDSRVTATFSSDDSLDVILTVICTVTKTTYTIDGRNVTIQGSGAP